MYLDINVLIFDIKTYNTFPLGLKLRWGGSVMDGKRDQAKSGWVKITRLLPILFHIVNVTVKSFNLLSFLRYRYRL